MAEQNTAPASARPTGTSHIEYNLVAGPLRCSVRLAVKAPRNGIAAIWRNEVGPADSIPAFGARAE